MSFSHCGSVSVCFVWVWGVWRCNLRGGAGGGYLVKECRSLAVDFVCNRQCISYCSEQRISNEYLYWAIYFVWYFQLYLVGNIFRVVLVNVVPVAMNLKCDFRGCGNVFHIWVSWLWQFISFASAEKAFHVWISAGGCGNAFLVRMPRVEQCFWWVCQKCGKALKVKILGLCQCISCECRKHGMYCMWDRREWGDVLKRIVGNVAMFFLVLEVWGNVFSAMSEMRQCVPCESVRSVPMYSMWECQKCGNVSHAVGSVTKYIIVAFDKTQLKNKCTFLQLHHVVYV